MDPLAGYAIAIFAITIIVIISNVVDGTVAALVGDWLGVKSAWVMPWLF